MYCLNQEDVIFKNSKYLNSVYIKYSENDLGLFISGDDSKTINFNGKTVDYSLAILVKTKNRITVFRRFM